MKKRQVQEGQVVYYLFIEEKIGFSLLLKIPDRISRDLVTRVTLGVPRQRRSSVVRLSTTLT